MKSMTGYAHAEYEIDEYAVDIEIRSVNSRFLEIKTRIPEGLRGHEKEIEETVRKYVKRGTVEVCIKISASEDGSAASFDEEEVLRIKREFDRFMSLTLSPPPTVSDYIALGAFKNSAEINISMDSLLDAVDSVLADFDSSRKREGERTALNIKEMVSRLSLSLSSIEMRAGELESLYREKLSEKYEELSGGSADPDLFLPELASILVKYTINEEISRLKSHLFEFERIIQSDGPIGKTIDFLCQEIQRECNTIGSKSQFYEVNREVVSMRDSIENIREQSRNIE